MNGVAAEWTFCRCGRVRAQGLDYLTCDQCPKPKRWHKALDAVDEWAHRNAGPFFFVFRPLCDLRDITYGAKWSELYRKRAW